MKVEIDKIESALIEGLYSTIKQTKINFINR